MKITSPWIESAPTPGYPPLDGDRRVDVCVIGAGVFGLTTALLLADTGRRVLVVEHDEVGAGTSGYTTAKVSALHETAYSEIASRHGADAAAVYAQANRAGVELVARLVRDRAIDCDFRRKPAYTYAADPSAVGRIEREHEAAQAAGLPVELTTDTDLPWEVPCAVRLADQAEFHPRRYVLALAAALPAGSVAERTRALAVDDGTPCCVYTDGGTVEADEVIVATHYPFLDRGLFFARVTPKRSYALGVRVRGALPQGMYISTGSTTRSVRAYPAADGTERLIVGGEGHKTGQGGSTADRYDALEAFARTHWDVEGIEHRFASQDGMTADGLPYVGRVTPVSRHLWTATGFRKWGFSNGSAAAKIVADALDGRSNPWQETFDSNRFAPRAAAGRLLKENVNVGLRFVGDRLAPPDAPSAQDLGPGEGGIVIAGGERVAAFRDDDGSLRAVSPVCTHLGCQVSFNDAERTWDCPCHGSRFGTDGTVIEGPATRDLERRDELVSANGSDRRSAARRRA